MHIFIDYFIIQRSAKNTRQNLLTNRIAFGDSPSSDIICCTVFPREFKYQKIVCPSDKYSDAIISNHSSEYTKNAKLNIYYQTNWNEIPVCIKKIIQTEQNKAKQTKTRKWGGTEPIALQMKSVKCDWALFNDVLHLFRQVNKANNVRS